MAEMEQVAGSFSVSANAELLRVLKDIEGAVSVVWETTEKAGQQTENMSANMASLVTTMTQYAMLMQGISQHNKDLLVAVDQQLNSTRAITDQLQVQSQTQKQIGEDKKKQAADDDEKARKDAERAERERQKHLQDKASQVSHVGQSVVSGDVGGLGLDALKKFAPELALGVGVVTAVAEAGIKKYRQVEEITSQGGGFENTFGSTNNYANISLLTKLNSLTGAASEAESNAALRMLVGAGGLRGDSLREAFQGLAEDAKEAGMSLSAYTELLTKASRGTEGLFDVSTVKSIMSYTKDYAAEQQVDVAAAEKLTTALLPMATQYGRGLTGDWSSIEMSGRSIADMAIAELKLAMKGQISPEEIATRYKEGMRAGKEVGQVHGEFKDLEAIAKRDEKLISDITPIQKAISDAILTTSSNRLEADTQAIKATNLLTKDILEGRLSMQMLNAVVAPLINSFEKTPEAAAEAAKKFDLVGKKFDVDGTKLAQGAFSLTEELAKVNHGSQSLSQVFDYSANIMQSYAQHIHDRILSEKDIVTILSTSKIAYHMSNEESEKMVATYAVLRKETGVAAEHLYAWGSAISKSLVPMFDDPKEAAIVGAKAMLSFGKMIEDGTVTQAEVTSLMKIQMDVFGKSGPAAGDALDRFKSVVEKSNVRMEEFNTVLSANYTNMRKYGITEQTFTDSLGGFSNYLRDTSMSMDAFNNLLKGPLGMNPAVQAMAYDKAKTAEGALGQLARGAGGVLGFGELLTDVSSAAQGGKVTGALQGIFGNQNKDFYTNLLRDLETNSRGIAGGLAGGIGATDPNSAQARALQKLLYKEMGMDFTGTFGAAAEAAGKLASTGELPTGWQSKDQKKDVNSLLKAYDGFGDSTKEFSSAVRAFKDTVKAAPHVGGEKQGPPSPRKTQSSSGGTH